MEPSASGSLFPDEPSLATVRFTSILELSDGLHKLCCKRIYQQCSCLMWHCIAISCLLTGSLAAGLQSPWASHGKCVTLLIIEVVLLGYLWVTRAGSGEEAKLMLLLPLPHLFCWWKAGFGLQAVWYISGCWFTKTEVG